MAIRHASEVSLSQDGGRKTWLRKDHHARSRLNEVRTRTRANNKEKGILNSAM
jgi:hypothetical protein